MSTTSGRRETASVADWPQAPPHPQGHPNPNQGEQGTHYSGYGDYSGVDHHQNHHTGTAVAPDLQNLQGLQAPQQSSTSNSTSDPSSNTNMSRADISHQNQQSYQQNLNQSNTTYTQQHQQYSGHGQHDPQQQQYASAYMGGYYQVAGDQYNFVPGNYPQSQQPELGRIIEEHSGQETYHHHRMPQTAPADITKHHYQPAVQVTEISEHQEVDHVTSTANAAANTNNGSSDFSGSFHRSSESHTVSGILPEQLQASDMQSTRRSSSSADQLNPASDPQSFQSGDQTGSDPGRQPNSDGSSQVDTRKRARVESSNEGDTAEADSNRKAKPPRGRPRVTTAGESQRDRRRKQIRDAQRAYRNRKDQAILDLEAKVKKLEEEKKDMAQEVSGFLDVVNTQSSAHHNAELSLRSRNLSHKVLASRTAGDGDGTAQAQSNDSSNSNEGFTFAAPSAQGRTPHMGHAGMASYNYYNPENLSYEVITQPTPENASFPSYIPDPNVPGLWNQHSLLSSQLANQAHGTLPSPRTYCAQESTFGRRLQRTSTERGLSLAMMERPPPDIFGAVFGFCLLFESRQAIIARLSTRLHILATETLHNWTVPFTNLGGAGIHSQEAGSSAFGQPGGPVGNEGYVQTRQPQHGTGFSMGPWRASVEEVRDNNLDKESRMNYTGFEGDFLDSDEVELYLRQRGIFIPGSADFVDVEIDLKDFESTNGAPIIRAPSTQQKAVERETAREQVKRAVEAQSLENQQMVLSTSSTNMFNPADPSMAVPDDSWASATSPKLKTTMDIAVLIEELANCSVCLGRTPGTRPKDIDRAVKIAVGIDENS